MAQILFFILALISVGAVMGMIFSKDKTHGALLLVLAFASLGGIFGLLDAPFVAAIQVLIYAGAIMVLFIFVLMMVKPQERIRAEKKKRVKIAAVVLGMALFAELTAAVLRLISELRRPAPFVVSETSGLGSLLFDKYLYAFEISSLLIVASLVGAWAILGESKKA